MPTVKEAVLDIFRLKFTELLLEGVLDDTKKNNVYVVIRPLDATACWNKKELRFTFIQYTYVGKIYRIEL